MEQKPSPEDIQRIIDKFKKPDQKPQAVSGQTPEDKKIQSQVEKAVEKVSQDPEATQG